MKAFLHKALVEICTMSPDQTLTLKTTHSTLNIWWATFLYFRYTVFLSNWCILRMDCVKQNINTVHRTNFLFAFLQYHYECCIFSFISADNTSTSFGILLLCWLAKYSVSPLLFSGSSVLCSYLLAICFTSDGTQHRSLRICCS